MSVNHCQVDVTILGRASTFPVLNHGAVRILFQADKVGLIENVSTQANCVDINCRNHELLRLPKDIQTTFGMGIQRMFRVQFGKNEEKRVKRNQLEEFKEY